MPLMRVASPPHVVALAVAVVLLVGCQPRASASQLEWCAENQAKVGRSALEIGVYESGMTFTDWKLSDPEGYNRACIQAFELG